MKINRRKRSSRKVSKAAIIKSVASSTAIETGERPQAVALKLRTGTKYRNISLGG